MDGLTHSYRNIQNVIAKLESGTGAKHALLVNCHFDSVPQSAGERALNVKTSNLDLETCHEESPSHAINGYKTYSKRDKYKCVDVLLQLYVSVLQCLMFNVRRK